MAKLTKKSKSKKNNKFNKLLLGLLIFGLVVFAIYLYRFTIYDDVKLINYHPSQAISKLATQDTMTSYARTIFYINSPTLLSQSLFAKQCPNSDIKQMVVLGCYHGNEGGIYILSVNDPTLYGIEQVTAAHEMLHGIYDRLSSSAKSNLDAMLENYYLHGLTDPRIKKEIALYQKTEPGAVLNEMNSTFGTECPTLPAALNKYYSQFFTNRQVIVKYEQSYQNALTSRETAVSNYDSQLSSLNNQINSLEATLQIEKYNLNNSLNNLHTLATTNPVSYQQQALLYNQQVNSFNSQIYQLQSLINQYNQIIVARNKVATQLDSLESQISSSLQTVK